MRGAAKHLDNPLLSTSDLAKHVDNTVFRPAEKLRGHDRAPRAPLLSRCLGNYLGELAHPAHYYLGVSSLSRRLERIGAHRAAIGGQLSRCLVRSGARSAHVAATWRGDLGGAGMWERLKIV